jgi:autotransporter-associated beta strand protein
VALRNRWLRRPGARELLLASSALVALASPVAAQDATWLNPATVAGPVATFDFNAAGNWSTNAVPTGTATFGVSTSNALSFSADTTVGGLTFNPGASNYTFTNDHILLFIGAGIVVNGGSATITNTSNGAIAFSGSSSAGSATIIGHVDFFGTGATAGTANITTNGGTSHFSTGATAGNATIINNSAGIGLAFVGASAGNATITTTAGAQTNLLSGSDGGTARFITEAGGRVIIGGQTLGSIEGAGGYTLISNGSTVGSNNRSTEVSGVIDGSNVTKIGTGTLTLSGSNIHHGTTLNGGTVLLAGAGTLGVATGVTAITVGTLDLGGTTQTQALVELDGGTLRNGRLNAPITSTGGAMDGIGGSASLTTTTGLTTITGTNTYTGGTTLDGGAIKFSAVNNLGTGSVTLNGGTLQWAGGNSADITSRLAALGGGGGTFDTNGNNVTFGSAVSGAGSLTKTGAGTLTLSAANSYVGGTTVSGGAINFSAANSFGTGQIALNGGALQWATGNSADISSRLAALGAGGGTFDTNGNNVSFASALSGAGALAKTGIGTLALSGVNTYTGSTAVNGGTLAVNGSTASSPLTTVNAGGKLSGIGTVGNTTINSGGTLAPGSGSQGTLTVQGNLVLASATTYMVQLSGSSASSTHATGGATLAGTVMVQPLSRLTATTTYQILSAASTTGSFQSVTIGDTTFARNAQLSYAGGNVLLTLDPGLLSPILPAAANRSQKGVAVAIDNGLLAGNTLPPGFNALFNLSGSNLTHGLTQVSGETNVGSQHTAFNAMGHFMGAMTNQSVAGRGGFGGPGAGATPFAEESEPASAYASEGRKRNASERDAYAMFAKAPPRAYEPRWSVWASGFGGAQTTDGNAAAGSNTATSRIFGTAVGADYLLSPNTIAGFTLAGGGTNFSVANGGSGRSDLFQAGAFVNHRMGAAYVSAALAYGWQDVTIDRTVTVSGVDRLRAEFNTNTFSGRLESGYRFVTPWLGGIGFTPYAAAQVTSFGLPAYAESVVSGANTFALSYNAKTTTAPRSELGLRTDKSFALADGIFTLRGRAAWAHDYNTASTAAATFQTLPGASFIVGGATTAPDAALLTASAERKWLNGFSLAATFEGEFSQVTRSYAGKGVARYEW